MVFPHASPHNLSPNSAESAHSPSQSLTHSFVSTVSHPQLRIHSFVSTLRSSVGGFDPDEGGAPGPGAYDVRSDFKPAQAVYKDPSVGVSSAFRSKTTRIFHEEGQVGYTAVTRLFYPLIAPRFSRGGSRWEP